MDKLTGGGGRTGNISGSQRASLLHSEGGLDLCKHKSLLLQTNNYCSVEEGNLPSTILFSIHIEVRDPIILLYNINLFTTKYIYVF